MDQKNTSHRSSSVTAINLTPQIDLVHPMVLATYTVPLDVTVDHQNAMRELTNAICLGFEGIYACLMSCSWFNYVITMITSMYILYA